MGQVVRSMNQDSDIHDNTSTDDCDKADAAMELVDSAHGTSITPVTRPTFILSQYQGNQSTRTVSSGSNGDTLTALQKIPVNGVRPGILSKKSWGDQTPRFLQLYGLEQELDVLDSFPGVVHSLRVGKPLVKFSPPMKSTETAVTTNTSSNNTSQQQKDSVFSMGSDSDTTWTYHNAMEELVVLMGRHSLSEDNNNVLATHNESSTGGRQHELGNTISYKVPSLPVFSFRVGDNNDNKTSNTMTPSTDTTNHQNNMFSYFGCQFTFTPPPPQQQQQQPKPYQDTKDTQKLSITQPAEVHNNPGDIIQDGNPKLASLETIYYRKILPLPKLRRKRNQQQTSNPFTFKLPALQQIPSSSEFTFQPPYPSAVRTYPQWSKTTGNLFSPLSEQKDEDDIYDHTKKAKRMGENDIKRGRLGNPKGKQKSTTFVLPSPDPPPSSSNIPTPTQQPCTDNIQQSSSNVTSIPASPSSLAHKKSINSLKSKSMRHHKKKKNKKVPAPSSSSSSSSSSIANPDNKHKRQGNVNTHHLNSNKCNNNVQIGDPHISDPDHLDLVTYNSDNWVCLFCQYEIFKNGWLAARRRHMAEERKKQHAQKQSLDKKE
ncbi:hypothetical protein BC941DRAFT_471528 [Chlamydoabsidia padenii]|nr:hypothetical protein BC941DRAFT_471528 [Chlamydoabsidia padenii]